MSTTEQRKAAFDGVVDKILSPLAEPLRKVMLPSIARAWDEGFAAGHDAGVLDEDRPANPYREN
jgi:hypothetical protein